MSEPRAITANLVDVKNVNTHKCVRLIIDVPAEQAKMVIDMFGWPTMVNPVPVAIARLEPIAIRKPGPKLTASDKRSWDDLSPAQQAGIRCGEKSFIRFLHEIMGAKEAAEAVRKFCDVTSRRLIGENPAAAAKWIELDARYQLWLQDLG